MVRPQLAGAFLDLLKIANLRCSFPGSLSQAKQGSYFTGVAIIPSSSSYRVERIRPCQ
jgi:hypothetical protein